MTTEGPTHDERPGAKQRMLRSSEPRMGQQTIPAPAYPGRPIGRPGDRLTPNELLALQRTIGNRSVARLVAANSRPAVPSPMRGYAPLMRRELEDPYHSQDLGEMANWQEENQRLQMQEHPPPAMQVNNITDASAARMYLSRIEGYRAQMQDGGRTGTISGSQIAANEEAIAVLSDYLVTVGEQGRTLSTFQQNVQQLRLDFGRVEGQMMHLQALGVVDPEQTSTYRAEQVVGAATGANSAEESAGGMVGQAETIRAQAQEAHDELMQKGTAVANEQRETNSAVHGLNSALNQLRSGIVPREADPELAAERRSIASKVSTMQSRLSTGLQVLSALGGAVGVGTAATRVATEAVGETLTGLGQQALGSLDAKTIASAISEEWYREETNQIEAQIEQSNAQHREAAINVNFSDVRQAQTNLFDKLSDLEEAVTQYNQARDTLRTTLDNLGASADREAGGEGYRIIAGLLGDVDVLVVQIDTTVRLGQTEEHAGGQATEARGRVEGTRDEQTGERSGGVTYYQPYQDFQLGNFGRTGGLVWKASANRILFVTSQRIPGSAYGGEGAANPVVRETIVELEEMREVIQGMRDVLSRSMGLSMQR